MMARTPETIRRHELAGLPVRVVDSTDPGREGIEGVVGRETTNTLVIDDPAGDRTWIVPKAEATFAVTLPDEARPVHVDGERLVGRPARRSEQGGESPWR